MTRILSYNILVGATRRVSQVEHMIRSVDPDVVGLVEATDPRVVEELARRLEMQFVMSGNAVHERDWQIALLSRLPIVDWQTHRGADVLTRSVLEATVQEPDGRRITIFVTHHSAAFSERRAGDHIRRREARELIRLMASKCGEPHLAMGDFNNMAPGDAFQASALLGYLVRMEQVQQREPDAAVGHPYLDFVVPASLRLFDPLLRAIPRSKLLCSLFDGAASLYAPRGSIALLRSAGYVDCFRALHPGANGFTCPAAAPAGRIDYIFASPELAANLSACSVVTAGEGIDGADASDHLPVVADFGLSVATHRDSDLSLPVAAG